MDGDERFLLQPAAGVVSRGRRRAEVRCIGAGLLLAAVLFSGSRMAAAPAADVLQGYPWLYLRGGEAPRADEDLLEVIAVGDVMLGRGAASLNGSLSESASWLGAADLALGNLEGVLALPEVSLDAPEFPVGYESYRLVMPPEAAQELAAAGFDLLGLANNHVLDLGAAGLAATAERLEQSGIRPAGMIGAASETPRPVLVEVDGLRLALLAITAVAPADAGGVGQGLLPALWDESAVTAALRAARHKVDILIVSIHWGYENGRRIDPRQAEIARKLVEAGADLVVGHHPHVVQGTEVVLSAAASEDRFGFIAYSLGNFAFDQLAAANRQGLALRAFFDRDGLRAVQALPLQAGPQPRLMSLDEFAGFSVDLSPRLPRVVFTCNRLTCQAGAESVGRTAGTFKSGWIDLTGDGQAEAVRLSEGRVTILEEGKEAWQSPPEWQVLDLALGDPNQDGRGEVLLALLKKDKAGRLRSHPFIIGKRGGIYRQVWGGSPVSEPIQQVELGDLDSDSLQELIVLDELPGKDLQTVGVWRWNGWGFSLFWRSEAGRYTDLRLVDAGEGQPVRISVGVTP